MPKTVENAIRRQYRASLREVREGRRTWEQHEALVAQQRAMAVAEGWAR